MGINSYYGMGTCSKNKCTLHFALCKIQENKCLLFLPYAMYAQCALRGVSGVLNVTNIVYLI